MNLAIASVDTFWSELEKVARRSKKRFYHGSSSPDIKVLRKGTYVTPHKNDAAVFAVPWSSKDIVQKNLPTGDHLGRPPKRLRFRKKPPKDHPLYIYEVSGRTKPALTNMGAKYPWNRVTTSKRKVKLVRVVESWQKELLEKKAEKPGHWRKLKPGQIGEGPYGAKSPGRTWVDTKPRKKKRKGKPKKGEYAPGIPKDKSIHSVRKISKPTQMRYVVQHHPAARAGDHHDIRLGDPVTGHAHSWATKKDMPKPGDPPIRVYQQPTHTYDYLDFRGHLHGKYGRTKKNSKGVQPVVDQRTEVLQADDNFIRFNVYKGRETDEFILTRKKGSEGKGATWYMINVTKTKKRMPKDLPFSKPKYKEVSTSAIDMSDDSQVMAAKLDGGHVTTVLKAGQRPRTYSYREPKDKRTGVIEHSQKVRSLYNAKVPKEVGNTILRGELYARDRTTKKPLAAETVGGMLNAGVWKSRRLQDDKGELRSAIFDVVKFRGKNMKHASYTEKLEALREIKKHMPQFEIPEMAFTKDQKVALLKAIKAKKHPATSEGVILWNAHKGDAPIKAKFKSDHDVYIRKVQQAVSTKGGKKAEAGALWYSLTPDGPLVGKVGTGFSRALRQDIWKRPHTYIGAVAKVRAQTQYKSGALGKPVFAGWHIDKSPQSFWAQNPPTK